MLPFPFCSFFLSFCPMKTWEESGIRNSDHPAVYLDFGGFFSLYFHSTFFHLFLCFVFCMHREWNSSIIFSLRKNLLSTTFTENVKCQKLTQKAILPNEISFSRFSIRREKRKCIFMVLFLESHTTKNVDRELGKKTFAFATPIGKWTATKRNLHSVGSLFAFSFWCASIWNLKGFVNASKIIELGFCCVFVSFSQLQANVFICNLHKEKCRVLHHFFTLEFLNE